MTKNLVGIAILIVLVWGIGFYGLLRKSAEQSTEIKRLHSNIEAMEERISWSLTTDGYHLAEVKERTLTAAEVKKILADELKTLDVKARDVKQVTLIAEKHNVAVKTDTIIIRDTISLPEYRYADEWAEIRANADSTYIHLRDSILVVSHAKTRRFLWWTWKRYSGKTSIKNYSPYSSVTKIEAVEVEK